MVKKDFPERERIGRRITELRKVRGVTQMEMARLTGLDQSHISRIEGGRYNATFDVLQQLASALGMTVDFREKDASRPSASQADAPPDDCE